MKKSLVAAGVIVALGTVWTGASWYTGRQLAQNIDEFTDNINAQIKSAYPDVAIKAVYRDYQGGIFSSKVTFVMQYDGSDKWQKPLEPGEEIVINNTVYHGPLPLSQLKKFNLIPTMAAVHAELGNTPVLKQLFDSTQNKPFLSAESRVAYSGAIASDIQLLPIEYKEKDELFSFSGTRLSLDITGDLRDSKLSGVINNIEIATKNPWDETERYVLKDLALDVNNKKGKFDLTIGDGKVTAKSLTVAVEGSEPVVLNNVSVQSNVTEDDKNLAGNTSMGLESLTIGDRNLGSGNLNINFSGFDGEGTKQFAAAYQKMLRQLVQQGVNNEPQDYQHQVMMTLLQNLPNLLKGNPSVTISPLSWKNSKGESTYTMTLDMSDPLQNSAAAADPQAADEEKLILQSIKKIDAKLNVPVEMLAELMVQSEKQPEGEEEKAQVREMALQQANMIASMGQMNGLSVTKDKTITSSLQYADGQIDFNGHKMPLSDFIAPLFGIPAENNQ